MPRPRVSRRPVQRSETPCATCGEPAVEQVDGVWYCLEHAHPDELILKAGTNDRPQ